MADKHVLSLGRLVIVNLEHYSLIGKTALITGGAGLLGKKHSLALLELGATVVLTDIDYDGLNKARAELENVYGDQKVRVLKMNVASEKSVIKTANIISKDIGSVDILINNAAINPTSSVIQSNKSPTRLENFDLTQWDKELSVGLTGAFLCSKVFGSRMAKDGGGVILNIASDLSVIAPDQRLYHEEGVQNNLQPVKPVTYSVIKAGLVGLTRYLASYWLDEGVRANALSPGGVYTGQDNKFVEKLTSLIPMGRMATEDEYVGAVQFLCSDASAYMTGQNIVIDGGRSIW